MNIFTTINLLLCVLFSQRFHFFLLFALAIFNEDPNSNVLLILMSSNCLMQPCCFQEAIFANQHWPVLLQELPFLARRGRLRMSAVHRLPIVQSILSPSAGEISLGKWKGWKIILYLWLPYCSITCTINNNHADLRVFPGNKDRTGLNIVLKLLWNKLPELRHFT